MRLFILSILFLAGGALFGQENPEQDSLAEYKTGEFYVLSGTDTCFVSRTADRQKESCTNSDDEYQFIVVWLKERKYILRDIHYNPSTKPRVMRQDVVVTVMEVGPDYHVVHARKKGMPATTMTVYSNTQAQ